MAATERKPQTCCVCKDSSSKYKCPTCLLRYCSLLCYKEHKDSESCRLAAKHTRPTFEEREEGEVKSEDESRLSDDDEDRVSEESLCMLRNSQHLQNLLCNRHLRQLVLSIDSSKNAPQALKEAMTKPIFMELADECLRAVLGNNTQPHRASVNI